VFVAVQVAMPLLVRPHLLPPTRSTIQITTSNLDELTRDSGGGPFHLMLKAQVPDDTNAWVLSSQLVDASGHTVDGTIDVSATTCGQPPAEPAQDPQAEESSCLADINRLGYRQRLTYQPSSRFWTFQWYETGIYAALALGLAGFCFRRIRHLS
jgi:hypothetical protein